MSLRVASTQLPVRGMDCPDCAEKIERRLQELPGVAQVSANLMRRMVVVAGDPQRVDRQRLKAAIEELGYQVEGGSRRCRWVVPDMECAACAAKVEQAIGKLEGIVEVSASAVAQQVSVSYDPERADEQRIAAAIRHAGYTVERAQEPGPWGARREKILTALAGLFFCGGLASAFVWPEEGHRPFWQGHLGPADLLLLVAALLGGANFFAAGLRALRTFSLDMNFLMTAAIFGAVAIGEYTEAAAIAFLFSAAQLLETYAVDRARASLRALMSLAPDTAAVRRSGQEVMVPVEQVALDEQVIVRPGQKIPVDGVVVEGISTVDQSPITGESMPLTRQVGDPVFAGTLNQEGYLEVRATRLASQSTLSRILQMVAAAEERRAPSEQFVRRFARYYTPAITLLALGIILFPPLVLDASFATWFVRGLTLLVLACPCALVISTPVAVVSAITSASRNGVLIKGGHHLETLGQVRVVAFDKTGTLTHGRPEVTQVVALDSQPAQEVLRLAAALEQRSQHPIARAILRRAADLEVPAVADFASIPGQGVRARIDGVAHMVGRPELFSGQVPAAVERLRQEGKTVVLVGREKQFIGAIAVEDAVRQSARATIEALHRQGIQRVVMLTGDHQVTARALAAELGVDEWRAELLPEEKVEAIEELRRQYGPIAMVGDGVNDAPALAASAVGIAMGAAGTDAALETADVALMADDLSKLPYLFRLSRASRRIIRQNVWASILVKATLVAGVFPGLVTLIMAVLAGDMGTSLAVIGNAMRLAGVRPDQQEDP